MNKRDLWEAFIKTGRVSDYLKYKRAEERPAFDKSEEMMTEFAEEFIEDFSQRED